MDIESIIINLVTNSYTACMRTRSNRKIKVLLKQMTYNNVYGYEITVIDSGPGINESFIDMIWQPLFSTKSNNSSLKIGTGLGLSIVKSTTEELGGFVTASNDSPLGGAQIQIWIPKN